MSRIWKESVDQFIALAEKHSLKIIMVGGGAVNFYGYQRHSADVDFWLEPSEQNFEVLLSIFKEMGYVIENIPEKVKNQEQNISIKFYPDDLDIELITNFTISKSFEEAYNDSVRVIQEDLNLAWHVISFNDLIESKERANRPKDLLDILELKKANTTN